MVILLVIIHGYSMVIIHGCSIGGYFIKGY
jgi:hypothetical protein